MLFLFRLNALVFGIKQAIKNMEAFVLLFGSLCLAVAHGGVARFSNGAMNVSACRRHFNQMFGVDMIRGLITIPCRWENVLFVDTSSRDVQLTVLGIHR